MTDNTSSAVNIDSDEMWVDEEHNGEHYASIYIPRDGEYYYLDAPDPEMIEYLNDRVGPRRAYGLEWYQHLHEDKFDWSCRGSVRHEGKSCLQFLIRDKNKAMMFKLTWAGR